jgi:ATP-dependent Clp protease ATP-binding subunit ClpA
VAEIRRGKTRDSFMNAGSVNIADLNGLEAHLLSRIKGQDHVIASVCSVLERGQLGLQPADKPLGSLLFLGPTGVGKTQLTLESSRYLFGAGSLFRFDMSEFLHADSVKLFLGDESGSPGRLGRVLSRHRRGVLLFDEIEKAHRLIWDLFLQMLDAARITLADHRVYNLSSFYIVCTSNIGSQRLLRPARLPFTTLERAVISELHKFFRPELIGRFDEKIVFKPLSSDTQREIARLAIAEELARFRKRGFDLTGSNEAFEFLVRRGIHKALGARPLKKTVQKFIGDAVRDTIKSNAPSIGVLTVSLLNERLVIETSRKQESSDSHRPNLSLD